MQTVPAFVERTPRRFAAFRGAERSACSATTSFMGLTGWPQFGQCQRLILAPKRLRPLVKGAVTAATVFRAREVAFWPATGRWQ